MEGLINGRLTPDSGNQAPENPQQNQEPAGMGIQGTQMPESNAQMDEQPTPEEQEAFDRVETATIEVVHKKETSDMIVSQLKSAENKPEVAAQLAAQIFSQIDEKSEGNMPETIILNAAYTTLEMITNMAEEAGIMQVGEAEMSQATQHLLNNLATMGYISEQDLPALQELMQSTPQSEIQQMVQKQRAAFGGENG